MHRLDPNNSFTPALRKARPQDRWVIVKQAQGGAPISRWVESWIPFAGEPVADSGDLYVELMNRVRWQTTDIEYDTVTFVWMQGERDAREESRGAVYSESFHKLIDQLEQDLDLESINIVIGRLSDFIKPDTKARPYWYFIRKFQRKYAETHPNVCWIDTDDLNGSNDDLHYTDEGIRTLGERFAHATVVLID